VEACKILAVNMTFALGVNQARHSPPITPKMSHRAARLAGQTVRAVAQLG
jgi:hypothetical protein